MTFEDILAEAEQAEQAKAVYYAEESFANITEYAQSVYESLNEGSNFDLILSMDDIVFESAEDALSNIGNKIGKFVDDCWEKISAAFDKVKEFFTKVINKVRIFVASKGSEKTLKIFNDNLDKETVKEVQFKYIPPVNVKSITDKVTKAVDGVKGVNLGISDSVNFLKSDNLNELTEKINNVNKAFDSTTDSINSIAKAVTVPAGTKLSRVNSEYIGEGIKSCNDSITKAQECYKTSSKAINDAKKYLNEEKKKLSKASKETKADTGVAQVKNRIVAVKNLSFAVLKATNNMVNVCLSILKITTVAVKRCLVAAKLAVGVNGKDGKLGKGALKKVSKNNVSNMEDDDRRAAAEENRFDD